jgi:hypothetical protein
MTRALVSLAASLGLALAALPAWAGPQDRGPPADRPGADPCATGQAVGNPCAGNPGNDAGVGNAPHTPPGQDEIWCRDLEGCDESQGGGGAPVLSGDGGAYISQIGEGNTAFVDQSAADDAARAVIRQEGEANSAEVRQSGLGGSVAELTQAGDLNLLSAGQAGAGHNSLLAGQSGYGNRANVAQHAAAGVNAAAIAQAGDGNRLSLTQSGSGNDAVLSQNGVGNAMSAAQSGSGNRLSWTQDGDHLPDLGVTQTGAMAISIHQSNGS